MGATVGDPSFHYVLGPLERLVAYLVVFKEPLLCKGSCYTSRVVLIPQKDRLKWIQLKNGAWLGQCMVRAAA